MIKFYFFHVISPSLGCLNGLLEWKRSALQLWQYAHSARIVWQLALCMIFATVRWSWFALVKLEQMIRAHFTINRLVFKSWCVFVCHISNQIIQSHRATACNTEYLTLPFCSTVGGSFLIDDPCWVTKGVQPKCIKAHISKHNITYYVTGRQDYSSVYLVMMERVSDCPDRSLQTGKDNSPVNCRAPSTSYRHFDWQPNDRAERTCANMAMC